MMVMTAKVDFKKGILVIAAAAALILAVILLLGGGESSRQTAAQPVSGNDARVAYLERHGWQVVSTPAESGQVKIPSESGEVFDRYNQLQRSQGFDLSRYAGKNVMRYVYAVTNYPDAKGEVYATLLMHKDQVIGADITDTAAGGQVRGLKMPAPSAPTEDAAS